MTLAEFVEPTLWVASWIVGICGGFVLGLCVIVAVVGLVVIAVLVVVWAGASIIDVVSSWRWRRKMQRIRRERV